MKIFLLFCLLLLLWACNYDPPREGHEITIHNQTSDYVYVTDTLPAGGSVPLYDTLKVNNRLMVAARGNYITKYDQWEYFFSENRYKLTKKQPDKAVLYFIDEKDVGKDGSEIINNRLYRTYNFNPDDIINNLISHIFYYNDSIRLEHRFDMENNK